MEGYIHHELKRCLEDSHKYVLLVKWETLEDHTIGFRDPPNIRNGKNCRITFMIHSPSLNILKMCT